MPKIHLTDIAIQRLKVPSTGQLTYWDNDTKNFGVRVSNGGARSFVVLRGTRRQRITIGRYPDIGLSDARREARRILSEAAPVHLPTIKFEQALHEFFRLHCEQHQRPSSTRQIRRLLEKHFLPKLHGIQLRDLSYEQISRLVHRLLDTPSEANHAFKAMRQFCRWAVRNRYLHHSPIEGMQAPARVQSRDRFLSDGELAAVWKGADRYGYPFGTIIKLLILTGQRRGQITSLQWDWINETERTISFPSGAMKNNRAHTVPYGDLTADIFENLPRLGRLLFPARGGRDLPFCGWSNSKEAFDAQTPLAHWTLHDLRRTFATNLAKLDVPPHVTERILSHTTGHISQVGLIYNQFSYLKQMRTATAAWNETLIRILNESNTLDVAPLVERPPIRVGRV